MSHLSPAEFVDLVDGTLPAPRAAHAGDCADCRAQAEALHVVLRAAADVAVPDPPPFFWDGLSARIRAAVAETTPASRWRALVPLASAAALVVAVGGGIWIARSTERMPVPPSNSSPVAERSLVAMPDDATLDAANGEVWDVLTSVASEMQIEDATAAGMTVYPAAVDRAVQKLTPDELSELGRLLQSELKRSGD
jgi:hypothetical protein